MTVKPTAYDRQDQPTSLTGDREVTKRHARKRRRFSCAVSVLHEWAAQLRRSRRPCPLKKRTDKQNIYRSSSKYTRKAFAPLTNATSSVSSGFSSWVKIMFSGGVFQVRTLPLLANKEAKYQQQRGSGHSPIRIPNP